MELPHLGKQCSAKFCNKLDFLPITCDACKNIFCDEHYTYTGHNCPKSYLKNNQVPVCPLCDKPIPIAIGQQPDAVVGAHIDNDCQSDPAVSRRKVFTNRCTKKGCKNKEVIPVVCADCKLNYCLKHRHPQDHACSGKLSKTSVNSSLRDQALQAALNRQQGLQQNQGQQNSQPSEDEQLARALALSMQDSHNKQTQEDLDLQLARQLQAMESNGGVTAANAGSSNSNQGNNQRCDVQ